MMVGSLLWLFGERPPTSIHVYVDVRASLKSVKIITMGRYLDWHMRNQSMVMRLSHPEHRERQDAGFWIPSEETMDVMVKACSFLN